MELAKDITDKILERMERSKKPIPVGVSNRHIHMSQEDWDVLFGAGTNPRKFRSVRQPGFYACYETVSLEGPKGKIDNVRLIAPHRPGTQVEVSRTDAACFGNAQRDGTCDDFREFLRVGIEDGHRQCGNTDAGPFRSQRVREPLHLSLTAAGRGPVNDVKIGGNSRISGQIRRRNEIERAAPFSALDVERQRQRVADTQFTGAGRSSDAVLANPATECRGSWRRNVAHLNRPGGRNRDEAARGVFATFH